MKRLKNKIKKNKSKLSSNDLAVKAPPEISSMSVCKLKKTKTKQFGVEKLAYEMPL